jgi:serine/threonine protein kinase/Flp pilus assembly protein TadD
MTILSDAANLDSVLEAYESAAAAGEKVDLAQYLPAETDPHYRQIASELIRVDMERSHTLGTPKGMENYRAIAPHLFCDPNQLGQIAFEDYRLRIQAGEQPNPSDYASRYGVDTSQWPVLDTDRLSVNDNGSSAGSGKSDDVEHAGPFPRPGEQFSGFDLIEALGRGAFGVVFRARQRNLAGREVVLKITATRSVEPQRLARLQHTNIVPIYSIHRDRGLLAICMPFLGRRTLAAAIRRRNAGPASAVGSTLADRVQDTVAFRASAAANGDAAAERFMDVNEATDESLLPLDINSIISVISQLAEGLAHAHARGIVHSDLKPANVLIGDDGSALLLDFNLSDDASANQLATLCVGGTLPYMAPEHLLAVRDGGAVTPSSDIFSLGVIFYELLTGQRPFPSHHGGFEETIDELIHDRSQDAWKPGTLRVAGSCAIGDIVAKCLSFQPTDRYQSADELAEDLRRHQAHLPLRYACESSLRERTAKWLRRNRRAVRIGTIVGLAAVAAITSSLLLAHRSHLSDLETARAFSEFDKNALAANLHLHALGSQPELYAIGRNAALDALQQFNLLSRDALANNSRYARLSADQQNFLRKRSVVLLYMLAQGDRDTRSDAELHEALRFNELAIALNPNAGHSSALFQQQVDLRRALSHTTTTPGQMQSPILWDDQIGDEHLRGLALLANERYGESLRLWQRLSEYDRQDPVPWFLLGNSYAGIGRLEDAESCYTAVIALQPRAVAGFFNRGMCRYDQRKFDEARQDFAAALKLRPHLSAALINRALAWHALGADQSAEADASAAIEAGLDDPRAYLVRALIRDRLHDTAAAAADRARGFELPPKDDKGWMARGAACLAVDPERAGDQFERGLREFPNSPGLMKNLIHVYADRLRQPARALPIIDRLVARRPADYAALASRAVAYARLGDRASAHRDAVKVAKEFIAPLTCLQLACVYALTANSTPEDSLIALRFVQLALAREPKLVARVRSDPDLESLKSLPEFDSLVTAASRLTRSPGGQDESQRSSAKHFDDNKG